MVGRSCASAGAMGVGQECGDTREHRRRRQGVARRLQRAAAEALEARRLLAATLFVDNPGDFVITTDNSPPSLSPGDTVTWNPGAGSRHGGPVAGLTFQVNAFDSIQGAVNAAAAGDTIRVAGGTFSEFVTVNKTLTLLGNQVGLDARDATRTGAVPSAPETIVNGATTAGGRTTAFNLTASDVTLDGFTVDGNTSATQFATGVLVGAGTAGVHFLNNVVQNNISGLILANNSATDPAVIQQNVFRNNNQPGPISGTGIYSDQFDSGGTLTNVLIDSNTSAGTPSTRHHPRRECRGAQSNVTVSSNTFTSNGNGVFLANTASAVITRNTFTASTATQVVLADACNGVAVTQNFITGGANRGVRLLSVSGTGPATDLTLISNDIEQNTFGGLDVAAGSYSGTLNAANNYWGSPTGPMTAANPGGNGQAIVDPDGVVSLRRSFQPRSIGRPRRAASSRTSRSSGPAAPTRSSSPRPAPIPGVTRSTAGRRSRSTTPARSTSPPVPGATRCRSTTRLAGPLPRPTGSHTTAAGRPATGCS